MAGATRECPHCRERILESAVVCPACKHHLRFDADATVAPASTHTPLRIEGSFQNPGDGSAWEYSVVVAIRDHRGVEIARKLIGVGALEANEQRSFTLMVDMAPAKGKGTGKASGR